MRARDRLRPWLVALLAVPGLGAAGNGDAPVAEAVQEQDHARLRALLERGADVDAPAPDGTTALHWAAHWSDPETVRLLVRAGADVDAANRYGATPLWLAAERAAADVVGLLLEAGADPNALALGAGESPLMAAARAGGASAVRLLLAHGADVDARDGWRGQTALMMAAGNHEPHADVAARVTARSCSTTGTELRGHAGGGASR